jgi:hypothetical protein
MNKNAPVHEVRVGRIRATVWANEAEAGTWHSVSFSRLYKDKDGTWQDAPRFNREDLPLLIKAADQAHSWLYRPGARPAEADAPEEASAPEYEAARVWTVCGPDSPKTPAEWQFAVDLAAALLALQGAVYDGGLLDARQVNTGRCRELLEVGRLRGFEPAPDAWRRFLGDGRRG